MKRIQLNTSKANKVGEQRKFYSDNIWYKVDSVNGMGFVEYLSRLDETNVKVKEITLTDYDLKILFL